MRIQDRLAEAYGKLNIISLLLQGREFDIVKPHRNMSYLVLWSELTRRWRNISTARGNRIGRHR